MRSCQDSVDVGSAQISMPPAGFEPAIPTRERLQTYASGRATTEIGG